MGASCQQTCWAELSLTWPCSPKASDITAIQQLYWTQDRPWARREPSWAAPQKQIIWEFPGGPGVWTWLFHSCGPVSIPGQETKIMQARHVAQRPTPTNKKGKKEVQMINVCCFKLLRCRKFVTQPKITNIWGMAKGWRAGDNLAQGGEGGCLPLPLPLVTAGHPQEPPETPL